MKDLLRPLLAVLLLWILPSVVAAQTAMWVGATDNRWRTASNWSPAVVPDENTDVIINYVPGNNQCTLRNGAGVGKCKSLTIGTGATATVFTENDGLFVYGNLTIGSNGTFTDDGGHLRVQGNWINNGVYTAGSANRRVYFIGTNQTIGGSTSTTFEKLYINSGSVVTLAQNISISNFIELDGTLDPTPSFFVTAGVNDINIKAGGELIVKAATYSGNYSAGSAQNDANSSVINYASTTVDQTIDPTETYEVLKISGSMTKSLSANTTINRDLLIQGGTLDLKTFTANRSSSGGSLTMTALTTLKIGGTNTFPTNYSSILLATNSLVEYYGTNQTVRALSYGNLTLSATNTATKTMPGTAFSVAGNFTSTTSAGTLSYTAGNNITVGGNINIGASNIFTSTAFSHSFGGNWINNGTYNGCGSIVTATGTGSTWSGSGVNNFGDLIISANGTIVNQNTSLSVCGNFSTTGGGSFTHNTGGTGTFTMTGISKTIAGSNIILDDLIIGTGGSISTTSTMSIAGDLTATGTFTCSGGTIGLTGAGKILSGTGALQFFALNVSGTITTARNQSIASNLSVTGSLTGTANTTTFNGTSTLSGTANLFNVTVAGASSLTMGTGASLGIAGAVSSPGSFNPTSNVPNTVIYNSSGAQTLVFTTFHNLILSNGNVKTPSAATSINGDLTIGAGTVFTGVSYLHTLGGNWINNGTFTSSTSTFTFTGNSDATITGTTTFNNLTVNKGFANKVTLNNNVTALNLTMTAGRMFTGSNSIVINNNRTGNGIILGTITRNLAAFVPGVEYAFEGPNNFINFQSISGGTNTINTVTVTVTVGPVATFAAAACMNRQYSISMGGGATSVIATLRLHYEDSEVNGNIENLSTFWRNAGSWVDQTNANTSNDDFNNWTQKTSVDLTASALWTLSEDRVKFTWTGATSSAWGIASNWSPAGVPTPTDVVRFGDFAFTNQPTVSSIAECRKIYFESLKATTLTLASGSLSVSGNIDGLWSVDQTHQIIVGASTLIASGDVTLSDGTANRKINISVATSGAFNVAGSLVQRGGAEVTFVGGGQLNIGKNYNYVNGTFTPSLGKVSYVGLSDQLVAGLTYYDLSFGKTGGTATIGALTTVTNNMKMATGGQVDVAATLNVTGNIDIGTSTVLNIPTSNEINIGGNWLLSGNFVPGSGTVTFNGTGPQTTNATSFNHLTVNKSAGTLTILGNIGINGNINVQSGTVDVSTFNVTRSVTGGTASLGANATARFGGAGFQLTNFGALIADPSSTVEFYGGSSRPIPPVTYGNLLISGGGIKSMVAPTAVQGNLTVSVGATLQLPTSTLTLNGNIINNGTLDGAPGTLILNGTAKTITGGFTIKELIVNGEYNVISGNLTINDNIDVSATGDFDVGGTSTTVHGNLTNSGILFSSGITTFTGLQAQTIQLNNSISSTSTGVVNFNGSVSPILNSNTSPTLATVNINNTAPINPSQAWTVAVSMNVAAGATWNGGALNHVMGRNFVNNGTVTSSGTLSFIPTAPFPNATINLGNNFITTGTVVFGGTVPITLVDNTPSFTSVDITNTAATGLTAATNWTVAENLFIGAGAEFKAGTGLTHTISGEWTNNGTFSGGTSSVIFNSNTGLDEITGSGINNFYNITFDVGSSMDVTSDIFVSRNFTNNATALNLTNADVSFTSATPSVIDGTTITDFSELVIDKTASSVRLDNDIIVEQLLTLTNGTLNLNANELSITSSSATAITRTNGYILSEDNAYNSLVNWAIGTDANPHIFPFGNSTSDYIPFTFDLSTGDAGTVSIATYATGNDNLPLPPGVTHLFDATGVDNSLNTVDRFYLVSLNGETTPNADITFTASATEVGTITSLLGQRWNGTFWDTPLPAQTSGATSVTVPNVTQFSTWAVSGNSTPLPITLASFIARQNNKSIKLEWSTASEINNDYFEIQKSSDGTQFYTIGNVKGAGNSTETKKYSFNDKELKSGRFFYRLKQVDLDKKFTYSYIVAVQISHINAADITFEIYPNPVTETLFVNHAGLENELVLIQLIDASGKIILKQEKQILLDSDPIEVNLMSLKPGPYIVQIISNGSSESRRVMRSN